MYAKDSERDISKSSDQTEVAIHKTPDKERSQHATWEEGFLSAYAFFIYMWIIISVTLFLQEAL